jgi:hypothetical protein
MSVLSSIGMVSVETRDKNHAVVPNDASPTSFYSPAKYCIRSNICRMILVDGAIEVSTTSLTTSSICVDNGQQVPCR